MKAKYQNRPRTDSARLTSGLVGIVATLFCFNSNAGIIGGDLNGIIGGDLNGIIGGDLNSRGIIGGDLNGRGIIGGDLNGRGIIGGDLNGRGIIGGDFIAVGPVEAIDLKNGSLSVLGLKFRIIATTKAAFAGRASATTAIRTLKSLALGEYVAVAGKANGSAIDATGLNRIGTAYVAGASAVYLKGVISAVNTAIGRAAIGNVWVDYTASLDSAAASQVAVGATLEVSGIQPVARGLVLSYRGIIGGDLNGKGIIGGDLNGKGIIGGDLNAKGIIGGDLNAKGIIGGDLNARGIIGGDLNGIIGGDAK